MRRSAGALVVAGVLLALAFAAASRLSAPPTACPDLALRPETPVGTAFPGAPRP